MEDLKPRTRRFAVNVIRYCGKLPSRVEYAVISRQLIRCATSVGANYRSALRAQSHAHFLSKLAIVEEEADETVYWLELIRDLRGPADADLTPLLAEADELLRIFVASKKTARNNSPTR